MGTLIVRRGEWFDPRVRACSLRDVASAMRLTVERVRVLEENALRKLRRQKLRDQVARLREAVEAGKLDGERYRWHGPFRLEFEPVFEMEVLNFPSDPNQPHWSKVRWRRAGSRTVRRKRGTH